MPDRLERIKLARSVMIIAFVSTAYAADQASDVYTTPRGQAGWVASRGPCARPTRCCLRRS